MATPYEQFLLAKMQQMAGSAPGTTAPPPPPPDNYIPGSTYVPPAPQASPPAPQPIPTQPSAQPIYVQPAQTPSQQLSPTAQPVNPLRNFIPGSTYVPPPPPSPDQALQQQYVAAQLPAKTSELRQRDIAYGVTNAQSQPMRPGIGGSVIGMTPIADPTGRGQMAYESQLVHRAGEELRNQKGWSDTLGQAKDMAGAALPDQLDTIGSAIGGARDAITGRIGVSEEATRTIAEHAGNAPAPKPGQPRSSGMPSLGDVAGAIARGAYEGFVAEPDILRKPAATLMGAVVQSGQPQMQVTEVLGQRLIDRALYGDENKTYDDSLITGLYEDFVSAGFSPVDFLEWGRQASSQPLIQRIAAQGYNGYTGGQAVYQFWRDQQGLGGVISDVAYDPQAPVEVGLTLATQGAAGVVAAGAKAVGKEAAGMALRNIIKQGGRAIIAATVDPFDVPVVARDALRLVAPEASDALGRTAQGIYRNVVLTERGRREIALKEAEQVGQRAARGIVDTRTAPTEPWLFERDPATGTVRTVTVPGPKGPVQRPLVKDPVTGVVRPVTEADWQTALQQMARMPHTRSASRLPGVTTPFEQMEEDWFGLGMNASRLRAAGLGRVVERLYPRHGPQYEATVGMYAARMHHFGQEVIDGLYEKVDTEFADALRELNRVKRSAPLRTDPGYAQWEKDILKPAQRKVVNQAYAAHMIEAAQAIADIPDAKRAVHKKLAKRVTKTAEALPGYGRSVGPTAMTASGATLPHGAPGTRLAWDAGLSLPDADMASLQQTMGKSGLSYGQELSQVVADIRRIKDLAEDAAARETRGLTLSKWDQRELSGLLKKYKALFPEGFDPADANQVADALAASRAWDDNRVAELAGLEFQTRVAGDQGWLTRSGRPGETGTDWADRSGPLGPRLSGAVRGIDATSRFWSKWLLHNPVRAPGFAALQLVGNAAGKIVSHSSPEAMVRYLDPRQWVKGYRQLMGDTSVLTNYDRYMQAKGLGVNPRVRSTLDPQRYGKVDGVAKGYFTVAKNAAATFDLANAQSAFMGTVLAEERRLQRWMRLPSGNRLDGFSTKTIRTPIETARAMGIPASRVPDQAIIAALDAARQGKPYGALSATEVKTALLRAANVAPGADPAIDAWVDRVGRDYINLSKRIEDAGLAEKDRVAFSWNETKADAVLSRLFMFHYWNSRASILYARNLLGSPAMLNAYISLFRTLQAESEQGGYPPWLTGFARFMLTPAGIGVFMDPTATFNTMLTFASDAMREDPDYFRRITPLGAAREKSPLMIHPIWDNLLTIAGAFGADAQPSQMLPTAALNREIYNLVNLMGVKSGLLDQPIDARLRNIFGGENSRAVAEFVQDRLLQLDEPMRARDANATNDAAIYFLMLQRAMNEGLTLEEARQRVYEEGGQFNPDSPLYQAALDDLVDLPTLGPQLGLDPESVQAHLVGALSRYLSPFPIQTDIQLQTQTGNRIGRYLEMQDAGETYAGIVDATLSEPVRIGGYRLQIPGTFSAVDTGGTVYTPDEIAAMDPARRQLLAEQYLNDRFPLPPGQSADSEFPEDAMNAQRDARAASPEDLARQQAEIAYWTPQDPATALAYDVYQAIGKAELEGTVTLDFGEGIAPEVYDNARLKTLTEGERWDLAEAWAALTGQAPLIEDFRAQQLQIATDYPDIGGQKELGKLAGEYTGGPVRFVEDLMAANPMYAEYATTLDPARYPPGTPDWANKMLSMDAYLVLAGERPKSTSPLAQDTGKPGLLPDGGTTSGLSQGWVERQEQYADGSEYQQHVKDDLAKLDEVFAAADAYDAEMGYAPGTSRSVLMQQIVTGDTTNYRVDKALYDTLTANWGGVTDDGKKYGPIPTSDKSGARQYILWALRQPDSARGLDTFFALSRLEYDAQQRAEGEVITDPVTGVVTVVSPEDVPAEPGSEAAFLSGLSLQGAADGSGVFLSTESVPNRQSQSGYTPPQPAAPIASKQVGSLGATLYAAPDGTSQPVANLPANMPLQVMAEQGRYVQVREPMGLTGWVAKAMLTGNATTRGTVQIGGAASPPPQSVAPTLAPTPAPTPAPALSAIPPKVVPPSTYTIDTTTYSSPNRSPRSAPPEGIVYHYTAGDMNTFMADFMGETGRQASANYVVDRDGAIYQLVDPDDAAWTHGDTNQARTDLPWLAAKVAEGYNMNDRAIGIEIVNNGNAANPGSTDPADFEPYTPEQIAAVQWLTNYLVQRYGITPSRDHLLGHSDINTVEKYDPGPLFPLEHIIAGAGGVVS